MSIFNLAADLCVMRVQEQLGRPSKEVVASAAGPALANAALLLAQGSPTLYVRAITKLFHANHLPCPDFGLVFDMLDELAPTQSTGVQTNNTDTVNTSIQTVLTDIDLQKGGAFSSQPVKDIAGPCGVITAPPPPPLIDANEYSESQQLSDMLKMIDNMATVTHKDDDILKNFDEVPATKAEVDDILENFDEVPATMAEVENILEWFDTVKSFSSTFSLKKHPQLSESSTFESIDANKTGFNSDFYNLTQNLDLSATKERTAQESCEWENTFAEKSLHFGVTKDSGSKGPSMFASTKILDAELPLRFTSTMKLDNKPPMFTSTMKLPAYTSTKKPDINPKKSSLKKTVTLLPPVYNSTPTDTRARNMANVKSSQLYNLNPVSRFSDLSFSGSETSNLQTTFTTQDLTGALSASNSRFSMSNTRHCSRQQHSYNPSPLDILEYLQQ